MVEETDSKRIRCVSLYSLNLSSGIRKGKNRRPGLKRFHLFFFLLYIFSAYWMFLTKGNPYQKFLERADREGFQVMEGTNKMRAELEFALSDINNPDRPVEKMGWIDWMKMDFEEQSEHKKREKEKSVLDSLPKHMRVPKRYAPDFLPMFSFGLLLILHALIMLTQYWSVAFNVWLNYTPVGANDAIKQIPHDLMNLDENDLIRNELELNPKLSQGRIMYDKAIRHYIPQKLPTHIRITPSIGKDTLVPVLYLPTLGVTFEYHRRRYVYNPTTQIWTKIRSHITMPMTFFNTWTGFTSTSEITSSQIRFGENVYEIKQPTFKELYRAQLLSPFTVFQIFCVILWLLDDYWQYSFFTLFMILGFEATVVFSRIKSLNALRGMNNKQRHVMVYRLGKWVTIESCNIVPGDMMSLIKNKCHQSKENEKSEETNKEKMKEDGDVVSADILLLRGSAVVNEASLTGESVPQIKEGLSEIEDGHKLNIKNQHRIHVLYAGTKMLQCKGINELESEKPWLGDDSVNSDNKIARCRNAKLHTIPNPPDGGLLCFVLRTGFSSAQGKLMRMIEGSQDKVKSHERETAFLLLLLFFFAVASSSYVLYHGLKDQKRSQYELLLHCILIITSVIPPELPMQMALAVNNSLMILMKMQVFCTEPYRVPIAGKLDSCLFDKTGTLTTDELVAVGVYDAKVLSANVRYSVDCKDGDIMNVLTPMTKVSNEAALVLAGCHSLVSIDGEITGDPLEIAALTAMRWGLDRSSNHVLPLSATVKKKGGKKIFISGLEISELNVLTRHHFCSRLQRMSCVVQDCDNRNIFSVTKGSPEAVGKLLQQKPLLYDNISRNLSLRGFRVIAMGYKLLKTNDQIQDAKNKRSSCEENIYFAGFIAFTCRVRKDTKMVVRKLKEGGMNVAMLTGDSLLTAAHVAREVGICNTNGKDEDVTTNNKENDNYFRKILMKKKSAQKQVTKIEKEEKANSILILEKHMNGTMFWRCYDDYSRIFDLNVSEIPQLSKQFDLATTGENLNAAFNSNGGIKNMLMYFKIFARMAPDAKEVVIECLHSVGILCLMCGDGANDVGALKQADVGVALLTGFGDVNVDKGEDGNYEIDEKIGEFNTSSTEFRNPEQLESIRMMSVAKIKAEIRKLGVEPNNYPQLIDKDDIVKFYLLKAREHAVSIFDKKNKIHTQKLSRSKLQAKRKADMAEKQQKIALRVKELESEGVQWAQFKALKEFLTKEIEENKKKNAQFSSVERQAATIAARFEDLEMDEVPMVKLGDASIAAPFTSKMPSIRSCLDIVRQGRCTLVTSMQMVCTLVSTM